MLGDTSRQQAVEKFAFIESLNLSESNRQQTAKSTSGDRQVKTDREAQASALAVTADGASSIDANWYHLDTAAYNLDLAEIIKHSTVDNSTAKSPRQSYLGKILFALACSYGLFVLWWLFGHQGSKLLTSLRGGKQIVLAKSDLEFIDYMERSLDSIERKVAANKVNSADDDVVYIPTYSPTPVTPPRITNNTIPSSTLPSQNSQVSKPVAVAKPKAATQALKIPAPPPLPAPTPIADSTLEAKATVRNIKPAEHTLVGILELGEDRSAVLVKAKGKTRRVWLGEEIGNSGWILDSIGNQNAKIISQGQVRSISVGETF